MRIKYYLLGFSTAFLIFLVSAVGYFAGRGSVSETSSGVNSTPYPTSSYVPATLTPTPKPISVMDVRQNITKVLETKNYLSLRPAMKDKLTLNIKENDCCGTVTKETAIDKLGFLDKSKGPWDMDEKSNIVTNLEASYPKDFDNAIVGVSRNNYVAAFQLDNLNMITKITLASDYKTLLP